MSGVRPPDSAILRYQRETADGTIHTYQPLVEERSNSLAGVLEIDHEVLRGVSLPSLLAGRARLFASEGQAARDDPSGTFALSKPVDSLSFFLSHSWRTSRIAKYCALCVHFNLRRAAVASAVANVSAGLGQFANASALTMPAGLNLSTSGADSRPRG